MVFLVLATSNNTNGKRNTIVIKGDNQFRRDEPVMTCSTVYLRRNTARNLKMPCLIFHQQKPIFLCLSQY